VHPSIIENNIVVKIREHVKKDTLTKHDIKECLTLATEYYSKIHGIRFKHLKNNSLPLDIYELLEKNPLEVMDEVILSFAKSQFKNYIKYFKSKHKHIYCMNSDGNDVFLPLNNRFSYEYMDKVKNRMKSLKYTFQHNKTVLLTLTLDPNKFSSKLDMWINIKSEVNRLLSNLRYYFKKQGRRFPEYLCTIQAQKNGNPHIHIVFFKAARLIDWRDIERLWGLGYIYINRSNNSKKIRYPINYITRYITRTFTKTDDNNMLTQALVWFFGIRSFSCSRGLICPLSSQGSDYRALCFVLSSPDTDFDSMYNRVNWYVQNIMKHRSSNQHIT
jgi:hypothetical protein